jgi:4-hydroxybenzoate polyprenyltransferase/phosphoserine phosphatase
MLDVRVQTPVAVIPLVVDLDNTLIRSDLLVEAGFGLVGREPMAIFALLGQVTNGKAALKAYLADRVDIDVATLPYNPEVLKRIESARAQGRPVVLASASPEKFVHAVADYLGLFDAVYASTPNRNLAGSAKAKALVAAYGERGFDYIGDSRADLPVWQAARRAVAIAPSAGVAQALRQMSPSSEIVPADQTNKLRVWLKALRVHQYAKNSLVLVPLIVAHRFGATDLLHAFAAIIAFSACASSVYLLNDLIDLPADRRHPSKRRRPFAAGTLPVKQGLIAAPLLLSLSMAIGAVISMPFLAVLITYFVLTSAYSFWLKRKMIVDVVVLALLYTIRVVGGAAAISVMPTDWLLAFSMFMFSSLALIKRYVELAVRLDGELPDPSNRNYKIADLPIVASLAAASGFNAVTVFALYVSSPKVELVYAHPHVLWLVCPILMYWLARMLMLSHRRLLDDDPIVFALRDKVSGIAALCTGLLMIFASI